MASLAPTKLNDKQEAFVAAYIGLARLNATKAAIMAGYSKKTARSIGQENLTKPDIQARIAEWREEVRTAGIADQSQRLAILEDIAQRLALIIQERGEEMDGSTPGGSSGFLVRQLKISGSGEDRTATVEYVLDAALIRELRATLDQMAKEMGQAPTTRIHIGGTVRHDHRHWNVTDLSDTEIEALLPLAERVAAGDVER